MHTATIEIHLKGESIVQNTNAILQLVGIKNA